MNISIGKKYKTRNGEIALITEMRNRKVHAFPIVGVISDITTVSWKSDGKYTSRPGEHSWDLMCECEPYLGELVQLCNEVLAEQPA